MNFKQWLVISEMAIFSPKYLETNSLQYLSEKASDPVLKARYKRLVSEWDGPENKKEFNLTPSDITLGSKKKINWKCLEKGHKWAATLNSRTNGGNNCSCCSNQKVCKDNNLQYLSEKASDPYLKARYKRLVSEWDKDNTLTPKDITPGSDKKINWKCKKGHMWKTELSSRTRDESNCPCCSNYKVCDDNNLQYLSDNEEDLGKRERYKRLVSEWDTDNTLTPSDVLPGTGQFINWKCKKGHTWEASLVSRTGLNLKTNCPICNESKGEEEIFKILQNYISPTQITRQYQDIDCRGDCLPLPFDFIVEINDKKYFIEYNGEQHYRPVFGSTPEERKSIFEKAQRYDKVKLEYCRNKKIPFLVIPYTQYKNIETIISSFLKTKTFDSKFAELGL